MIDINSFIKSINKQKLRCEGIIVMRHGEKIAEHRWVPETPVNVFSVSKSFVSVAAGMAIDRGLLSTEDRAADIFSDITAKQRLPAEQRKRLSSLTLDHLLTMTRGHGAFSRPSSVAEALAQPLDYPPGSRFVYDNGSTFLASAMFTRKTGKTVHAFLTEELLRPLGIRRSLWPECDGHTVGATGLELTTGDLALFGEFLLRRGEWRGKRLLSPGWIDNAGRPHANTGMRRPDWDLGYGRGFWPCRHGAYRADGKNGQFVIVLPRQDAVIAINSNEPKPYPILYAVWDEILPLLNEH